MNFGQAIEAMKQGHCVQRDGWNGKVDRIWRGKMLPCCPHCDRGIAPEDHLGANAVSRSVEEKRRKFEKQGGRNEPKPQ